MPTAIRCAACGARFNVSDALIGKRVRCNSCTHVILVRAPTEETAVVEARRPARRRPRRVEDDEDVRLRRRRSRDNQPMMLALIVGGIAGGVLLLGLSFAGMWWLLNKLSPSNGTDPGPARSTSLAANPAPPAQGHLPPVFAGNPMPPNTPQPPFHGDGSAQTVQLSNARVSGFGARIQIEVDFRFNTGVADPNLYLMVKPTRFGLHQNLYEVHLHHAIGKSEGTIVASGITFGIENGPFEVWMEEGSPLGLIRGMGGPKRRTISNVLRVQTKDFSLPGPMFPPGMPRMPGMPPPRFPFGPRH